MEAGQDVSRPRLPAGTLRAGRRCNPGPACPPSPTAAPSRCRMAEGGGPPDGPRIDCGAAQGSALTVLRPDCVPIPRWRLGRAWRFRLQRKLGRRPPVHTGRRSRAAEGRARAQPHCRRDLWGSAGPERLAPGRRVKLSRTIIPTKIPVGGHPGGAAEGEEVSLAGALPRRQGHP